MDCRCATVLALALVAILGMLGAAAPDSEANDAKDSQSVSRPFNMVDTKGGVSLHKDMYMLPGTWSDEYHGQETEVVFGLTSKVRILETRLFFAYSQVSFWQAYNAPDSKPFRETNYNPELFYRFAPLTKTLEHWGLDLGLEHESNGGREETSRSWNRLYAAGYYQADRYPLYTKFWYRFEEDECPRGADGLEIEECRDDPGFDNNPDLTDFTGYGELHVRYRLTKEEKPQELHLMTRGNLATGKGYFSLDYSYPGLSKDLHWFAKFSHGYAESLMDYNRSVTRFGIGVLLH